MNKTETINLAQQFNQLYFQLRKKEGRIYTDEEVATLPFIHQSHRYYSEWAVRKHSLKALLSYLKNKNTCSSILEVGCGNGWLSSRIAKEINVEVTGIDINTYELKQATRVFQRVPNLNFINGSLQDDDLKDEKFDIIIFAASIQYFPSLKSIIKNAVEHLTLQGEVHILDSPFYHQQETAAARSRTAAYFKSAGFAAMTDHYHHHDLTELENFRYKILHHPNSWKNKLSIKKNPFYWISIKNRYQ